MTPMKVRPYCAVCLAFMLLMVVSCRNGEPLPVDPQTTPQPQRQALPDENAEDDLVRKVAVYYGHPIVPGVVPVEKEVFKTEKKADLIKQVIDHLTIAPSPEDGYTLWPDNTYVREVYTLTDGTVVVDFDERFIDNLFVSVRDEDFMITSLVNSIVSNFPEYDKVRILVQGEVRETFLGHVDIEFPLAMRNSIYTIVPTPHIPDEIVVEPLDDAGIEKNL